MPQSLTGELRVPSNANRWPAQVRVFVAAVHLVGLLFFAGHLHGQHTIQVTDGCATCRVTLDTLLVVSDEAMPGAFGIGPQVTRDPIGRWYVTSYGAGQVFVLGPDGQHVATIGRSGEGPGEFRTISELAWVNGHLLAYDYRLLRRSHFDSTFQYVQGDPLPASFSSIEHFQNGTSAVAVHIATPDLVGYTIHLLDSDGASRHALGYTGDVVRPDQSANTMRRRLGLEGDSVIWSAPLFKYRLEAYALDGSLRRVLTRDVDWFPESSGSSMYPERPPAGLTDIHFDDRAGILWALAQAQDPDWTPPPRPGPATQEKSNSAYDSVVEAIDVQTGEALAHIRLPDMMWGFSDQGFISHIETDTEAGVVWLRVVSPTLRR
ncbi:MAG: hypothetical protein WEA24_05860 [Gemmatimonadota bacterium]